MAIDINLLPEEEREKTAKDRLRKRLNFTSVTVLLVTLLLLFGVFSYWGFLKRREAAVTEKIRDQEGQLQSLAQVESFFRVFKAKSQAISQIFKAQKDFGKTLSNFSQFVPNGVYLTDFSVGEDSNIKTSGVAANSQEFSNLILTLVDKDGGGKFYSQISVDSLSGAQEGGLKFGLSLSLKQ